MNDEKCKIIIYFSHMKDRLRNNLPIIEMHKPVRVIWITVREKLSDCFCHLFIGQNIPESVSGQDQHIVCSMLVSGEIVDSYLK